MSLKKYMSVTHMVCTICGACFFSDDTACEECYDNHESDEK